jgi:5-methylcytosine-specific restriction protein A
VAHLAQHPLCVVCQSEGRITAATVVDHIVAIADAPHLRLEPSNHRSLCKRHHDQRTGRDQAWGRKRR